jgi:hypothetical protein|tara:strand:+ start:311 stop:853 length:543 start_codon:yes stop_codon:yes gene_type:complete
MEITIDIQLLIDNELSADEYLTLYAIYKKGFKTLDKLQLNADWDKLQEKGFVKQGASVEDHVVRQEFIDLFSSDFEQMFAELVAAFPRKVNSGRGVRILRAADASSSANRKAMTRYRKIVLNKPHVHKKIMGLLDNQLKVERDNLGFLQSLEVWINNHTWEKYTDIDGPESEERRITRKL